MSDLAAQLDDLDADDVENFPDDPDWYRAAYDLATQRWEQAVAWARTFPEEALHESVGGEWSFIQTLRHLLFATDVWVARVIRGNPRPWDALDLPYDQMTPHPEVPWDRAARPSLDEVLALRAGRQALVRDYLARLTTDTLAGSTTPVEGPGFPPPDAYRISECLIIVINEEWRHRQYAERDLATLEAAATA